MGKIKDQTIEGLLWSATGTLGSGFVSLVITMILARLIEPKDFGIIEIVLALVILTTVCIDSGFTEAVIRDKNATQRDLSSVFYFNLGISVFLYLTLYFAVPLLASFYKLQSIVLLSRVMFLKLIFDALSMIQLANCYRLLHFKPPAKASLFGMILAGILSIISAYKGLGIWALVINTVGFSIFKSLFLWIYVQWIPSLEFSKNSIKRYFNFGGGLLAFSIIDKIVTNMESLLIGKVYSRSDLGYFSQARKFDSLIVQTIVGVIQKVTYPSLVQVNETESLLKEGYRKVMRISMFCLVPLAFFLFVSAESFMGTVYGEKWISAAPYLRAFSVLSIIFPLYSICINIFKVKGYSFRLLQLSILHQSVRVLVIILLLRKGVLVLTWGIVASMLFGATLFIPSGGKLINYNLIDISKDLTKTFLCSMISAGLVYFIARYFVRLDIMFLFAIQGIVMFISYWVLNILCKNNDYSEFKEIVVGIICRFRA